MINNTPASNPAPQASISTNSRTDLTPPKTPFRAVSYCRVSSETQREKETVKTQIELNEKFCVANGYTLVETYVDDGVSGTTHLSDRPAGARLLADARAGRFEAVVVYKSDRLGRSALVNETLALELHGKLGIAILGVAESIDLTSPIGQALFTFSSAIGRLERENTLQRSRDATLRLAREGAWLGGIVPFGYRVEGKERAARLVVSNAVNPATGLSEDDVVRLMFTMAGEEGKSSIQIAEVLNELGVPTSYQRDGREVVRNKRKEKTQEVWRGGRVRNLLVEPTYKGVHIWGKRSKTKTSVSGEAKSTIERAVPAIVDGKLWDAAQLTLRRNRLSRPDIQKRPYLLRGLMKCAHCGLTYIGTVSETKKAARTGEPGRKKRAAFATILHLQWQQRAAQASRSLYKEVPVGLRAG